MKYITCQMGSAFVVGLEGTDQEVEETKNLAHNIFNAGYRNDIFNGRINFASGRQFAKFLIYKEWLNNGQCLRKAAMATRQVLAFQTKRKDFMKQLRQRSNNYYEVSEYGARDEGGEE